MAELLNTKTLDTMSLSTEVASAVDISTFVNTTASDTLGGANTYTDTEISKLSTDFNARITALEGFTSFIGVKDSLPETAEDGQICIVGNKEYIYGSKADGTVGWTELGDTTAETAAIEELSGAVAALETTKANVSSVNASVETLRNAIIAVETSLSGYDTAGSADAALTNAKAYTDEQIAVVEGEISSLTDVVETKADKTEVKTISDTLATYGDIVTHNASEFELSGSADAALTSAKAYTDEQIAAIEGEISSLTDVVETKADQTAVDAAINAINENISTLSAKTEEDPVFTAWKDGTSVALGSSATANGNSSNAIGYYASASGSSNAIGNGATASGNSSNAIGNSAYAVGNSSNAMGNGATANGNSSNAIGNSAYAEAENATQIGVGTNSVENSLQFRSTQIVDGNGKITTANLAGMSNLKDALNNVAEVTASDDIATLRATVNTLAAAIKTFAGL